MSTIRIDTDIDVPTVNVGQFGDSAQETAARLEMLALEAELARHNTGKQPTPFTFTYHVPGRRMVSRSGVATQRDALAEVTRELDVYMRRYGLTEETLFSPSSPVRIAFGQVSPAGNIVTSGNWPSMLKAVSPTLSILQMAIAADDPDKADDLSDLEIVVTTRSRA